MIKSKNAFKKSTISKTFFASYSTNNNSFPFKIANPDEHVKMFRNIFTLPDIEEIFGE
jgi:hypothetical protein